MSRGAEKGGYTLYALWWKFPLMLILALGMLNPCGVQHSLLQLQQAPHPTLKWVYVLPKLEAAGWSFVSGDPALGPDGTVYVTWECLIALDPQGALKWQITSGSWNCLWDRTPMVDPQGDVYGVGYSKGEGLPIYGLYGLDSDGSAKWFQKEVISSSLLALDQDTLYASEFIRIGDAFALTAISAKDGSLRWRSLPLGDYLQDLKELLGVTPAPPVIMADGTILVLALAAWRSSGEGLNIFLIRYRFSPDGSLQGVVMAQLEQSDRISSSFPWRESLDLPRIFSPAIGTDSTLYVTVRDDYLSNGEIIHGITLYALNPEGKILWSWVRKGEGVITDPVLDTDGTIYLGLGRRASCKEVSSTLYAIGPDGQTKWSFPVPSHNEIISGTPAVGADGMIYLPTSISKQSCPPVAYEGKIYALSSKGELLWVFEAEGDIRSSPTLTQDGTLYFTTVGPCQWDSAAGGREMDCEGRVYALQTGSPGLADSPWPMFRHDPQHSGRLSQH